MTDDVPDFEAWYRSVHPRLSTSLTFAFGDVGLAQDAADEACARALERWDRVAAMDSPTGWVFQVGFNVARRRLRRNGFERRFQRTQQPEPVGPPAGELWAIVADLPPRQRQAVVLRHVGQLREAEVGAVMGISRGAVSSTLRAAYQSLRIALTDPVSTSEAR